MTALEDRDLKLEGRGRTRKCVGARSTCAVGGLLTGRGFVFAQGRSGDEVTQAGVLAGIGVGLMLGGAAIAWKMRPNDRRWRTETATGKRERLQGQRTRQLWLLPMVSVLFLVQGTRALNDILAGQGSWPDYLGAALPVLYAWVAAAIALGWDWQSRKERRFMEDELTVALRARAVGLAFVVLMGGATLTLGLALWSPRVGVLAIPFVLVAGGAAAAIRFAWLDREAGRDG